MLLLIDNYDSFTYNLASTSASSAQDVRVERNDAITVDEIAALAPDAHRDLARAVHAERGRHLAGRDRDASPARSRSSASASATRRSARRSAARSCAPRAVMHGKTSKIFHDEQGRVRRAAQPVRGDPLPLAGDRARERCPTASRSPPRPGTTRSWALRHKDRCAGRGRAVPPRVDHDHRGQGAAARTSSRREAGRERVAAGSATRSARVVERRRT